MSDPAKKLDEDEISKSRDTIPDASIDPQIVIIDSDLDSDQIEQELFGVAAETTHINIKIPAPPESALVRKMVEDAHSWAQDAVIVDLTYEPEPENPNVTQFKKDIHQTLKTVFFSAAWEYLAQPADEKLRNNLEHVRKHALNYSYKLSAYRYSNYIDTDSATQVVETLNTDDWFSQAGLIKMEKRIRNILGLPLK